MRESAERRLERLEASLATSSFQSDAISGIPNVIDFVVSPEYLNRPRLYPGQATLLKVIFLADDLFTDYDHRRLAIWGVGEKRGLEVDRQYGAPSDLYERIAINKAAGRRWFREVAFAGGRRSGKGYIGALAIARIIWFYLQTGDPQEHLGVASGKTLTVPIFAQSKDQARDVFWRDLLSVINKATCYRPHIAEERVDKLTLWSPAQLSKPLDARGLPAIEVVARESTESAARGYASPIQVHDEMAHAIATGSARSAEDIWDATAPAQAQFGAEAFTYAPSSPRDMTGRFFELHRQGLEVDPDGTPTYPEILSVQFPSWELYQDWDKWAAIPLYRDGPTSSPILGPVISESHRDVQRARRTNPEMYRVEYQVNWAEVQIPFLEREHVLAIRDVYDGRHLETRLTGDRRHRYFAHGDLSLKKDDTVLMIAHSEVFDDPGRPHIFIDYAESWSPSNFPEGHINLGRIEEVAKQRLSDFPTMVSFTFDQFQSAGIIEKLKIHAQSDRLHAHIGEFTPNRSMAYRIAETAKVALYERRIHSPDYPKLVDELLYLQDHGDRVDHPSTGPVTHNDWVTCLFAIVHFVEEATHDPRRRFTGTSLRGMPWPEGPLDPYDQQVHGELGGRLGLGLGSAGGQRRETLRNQRRKHRKR